MSGIPNELWRQLTALIGNDRDEEDNGDEAEIDEHLSAAADQLPSAEREEETPMPCSERDADRGDEEIEAEVEAEVEEADESDDEQPVEIGVDECIMLKECLEKKLASLIASEERYCSRQILLLLCFDISAEDEASPLSVSLSSISRSNLCLSM